MNDRTRSLRDECRMAARERRAARANVAEARAAIEESAVNYAAAKAAGNGRLRRGWWEAYTVATAWYDAAREELAEVEEYLDTLRSCYLCAIEDEQLWN